VEKETNQFDLREIWALLLRRKLLIAFPVMIVPMIAIVASFFMTPVYESSVSILISESKILPPIVEQELEGRPNFARTSERERTAAIFNQITSSKSLKRLIISLDIPIDENIKNQIAESKLMYPDIPENELAEELLAADLKENIEIQLQSGGLISITMQAHDPIDAQQRCGKIAEIFIEESLAKELAGVEQNIVFSEKQLEFFRGKLKDAENKLRGFRQRLILSDVENDTSGFNIPQIMSAIDALDIEMSIQEAKQIDSRRELLASNIDVANLVLTSEIQSERSRLLSMVSDLTELLSKFSWSDPRVLTLNENAKGLISNLNNKIKSMVQTQFASKSYPIRENISNYLLGQMNVEYNRSKRSALDKSIVEIKSRLSRNPGSQITMSRLQSEIDHYKTLYELFASHTQFAVIDQSAKQVEAEAKFNIVKAASFPFGPESPDKKKLLAMGLILGMLLGGGAVLFLEILNTSYNNVDDVEAYLNLKVLGTIPNMNLPFSSNFKKKLFVYIGVTICFILASVILYLRYTTA